MTEPRRPWSLSVRRRRQIAKAYARGMAIDMIAFVFDVSPQYPGRIARRYGVPTRQSHLSVPKRRAL